MTLRALSILAAADAILAEDTRVSRTLLARYGIETPLSPYHEHNAAEARPRALAPHRRGPGAGADLGRRHAARLRPRLQARRRGGRRGALGHRSARRVGGARRALRRRPADRPLLLRGLFAAPQRGATRADQRARRRARNARVLRGAEPPRRGARRPRAELGPRPAAVARELTKLHEEVRRGTLDALAAEYAAAEPPRGEIVVVVGPPEARKAVDESDAGRRHSRRAAKPCRSRTPRRRSRPGTACRAARFMRARWR